MASKQALERCEAKVKSRVGLMGDMLKAAGIPQEVYLRTVLNALILAPQIAECDGVSVEAAIMHSVNARLLPDGKDAAIVPYKGKAVFQPMIDGQVKLAHMASPGLILRVLLVYQGDEWDYTEGLYPRLVHTPDPSASHAPDDIIAAYATGRTREMSEPMYEVMFKVDIDRHRAFSSAKSEGSPWQSHYGAMAKKTVLRQLLRRLPQPSFADGAIEQSDDMAGVEMHGYDADDFGGQRLMWRRTIHHSQNLTRNRQETNPHTTRRRRSNERHTDS